MEISLNKFPVPTKIIVSVAPYLSVAEALADEKNINWLQDEEKANAITIAFAALELKEHLMLADLNISILNAEEAIGQTGIYLTLSSDTGFLSQISQYSYKELGLQGYSVIPKDENLFLVGNTRTGVLYGVYGLLEYLGFSWYDQFETQIPTELSGNILWSRFSEVPSFKLRGFWIYGNQASAEFYQWMARNRLNIAAGAPGYLRGKLGIKEWGGGHHLIQEEFSREGLFEEHQDWFAEINGVVRRINSTGNYFNPAFWNNDAAEYFAQRIFERLSNGDLQHIDVLNIWPSDATGNSKYDQRVEALAVGNETDNLLNFYVALVNRLEQAYLNQEISRKVTVAGISYFITWKPPTNSSIVSILNSKDNFIQLFYLSDRSWNGAIQETATTNEISLQIMNDLEDWKKQTQFKIGFVEYYNFSVYSSIAITDYQYMSQNFDYLNDQGSPLFAYMHPLATKPGPRKLMNQLFSKLPWYELGNANANSSAKANSIIDDYFFQRFGSYSGEWREIYKLMSDSVDNAKEIYARDSLYWLIFNDFIWVDSPYTNEQRVNYIPLFKQGGLQELPIVFSNDTRTVEFRGLDASLELQYEARKKWEILIEKVVDAEIKKNIQDDIEWFTATCWRYELMSLSSDLLLKKHEASGIEEINSRMRVLIDSLRATPVTHDTISPVDQRRFLDFHERLLVEQ